ncbi:hypothetical protein IB286_13315 [Spongiibacter sp. KMU-158]|uniref:Uncharacterized protein n=1 Tax=Spongiibacter pelagi TaxID=2760804 RepID=A0A927GXG7_9GAMM|nr:hypothetical protein [Spongiibacter pelagi]MBD2859982.1 hypothetical protein [Spongiibacter pelagi]
MRNTTLRLFVLASLILFGMLYYYSGQVEKHYAENSSKYLNNALSSISDWQASSLREQLSRDTQSTVSDAQLEKLTQHYAHFGKFVSMEEPVLSRVSAALSVFADKPRLGYSSRVKFEKGSAIMTATLTIEDERFKFYNLSFGPVENEVKPSE